MFSGFSKKEVKESFVVAVTIVALGYFFSIGLLLIL